jgi:hypothetical protein
LLACACKTIRKQSGLAFTLAISQHSEREYNREHGTASQKAPGSRPKHSEGRKNEEWEKQTGPRLQRHAKKKRSATQ